MTDISVTARTVFDILNPVALAVENLACHQEQCDQDGVMVKVSRQALDEVLNAINDLVVAAAQDSLASVGALPPRAPSSQPAESAGTKTRGGK